MPEVALRRNPPGWAAEYKSREPPTATPSFRRIFRKDRKDLRSLFVWPLLSIGGFSDLTPTANHRKHPGCGASNRGTTSALHIRVTTIRRYRFKLRNCSAFSARCAGANVWSQKLGSAPEEGEERAGAISKPQRRECLPAYKESIPFPMTLVAWAHLLTHGRTTNLLA